MLPSLPQTPQAEVPDLLQVLCPGAVEALPGPTTPLVLPLSQLPQAKFQPFPSLWQSCSRVLTLCPSLPSMEQPIPTVISAVHSRPKPRKCFEPRDPGNQGMDGWMEGFNPVLTFSLCQFLPAPCAAHGCLPAPRGMRSRAGAAPGELRAPGPGPSSAPGPLGSVPRTGWTRIRGTWEALPPELQPTPEG